LSGTCRAGALRPIAAQTHARPESPREGPWHRASMQGLATGRGLAQPATVCGYFGAGQRLVEAALHRDDWKRRPSMPLRISVPTGGWGMGNKDIGAKALPKTRGRPRPTPLCVGGKPQTRQIDTTLASIQPSASGIGLQGRRAAPPKDAESIAGVEDGDRRPSLPLAQADRILVRRGDGPRNTKHQRARPRAGGRRPWLQPVQERARTRGRIRPTEADLRRPGRTSPERGVAGGPIIAAPGHWRSQRRCGAKRLQPCKGFLDRDCGCRASLVSLRIQEFARVVCRQAAFAACTNRLAGFRARRDRRGRTYPDGWPACPSINKIASAMTSLNVKTGTA